jgi:hypothetical protein
MPAPFLVIQTTYAELLERCASAAFNEAFPANGTFVSKTIKNRRYWYFQVATEEGRAQRYVGPETPELLERIANHKEARDDERERTALVSTLIRSFGMPRPIPEVGQIIAALERAGVFRLRGVLVGTVAYQTYSAMLGAKLPDPLLQTGDIDIAQFKNISVAIGDHTPPVLEVLKNVDKTFRAVPHVSGGRRVTSYAAKSGLRVDFLTPNEGPDTDTPEELAAFQTDAQPLRFLDFLIHEPEPAVILYGPGVYVHVPTPERFGVHKLIVSQRRRGSAKRDKDIRQAQALLDVLIKKRPHELKAVWVEAEGRGEKWKRLLLEGMMQLEPGIRESVLKSLNRPRAVMPGVDLVFANSPVRYDDSRDVVTFTGDASGARVQAAISREAMDDYFGTAKLTGKQRVEKFLENRSTIEQMARTKYLQWPVEDSESVLIKTADVPKLLNDVRQRSGVDGHA